MVTAEGVKRDNYATDKAAGKPSPLVD